MAFAEHHDMIEALPADRADQPLYVCVLPGRTRRRRAVPNADRSNAADKYLSVCTVVIPDQVSRDLLPAASLGELIGDPFGRWMRSNTDPQQLPPAMTHNQQAIEQPERHCRHHEQVHRGDPISMVTKDVLHPCEGGTLLRTIYLATLVWPTSMPSLRSSPWILGAPHNGLATLIWRISWRISTVTAGRPQRCFDFHRQYDLNPARCQRITVSGRTMASAPYILGNSRQTPPNINLSIETNRSLLGLARRSTLICCLSTRFSASSATCDREMSIANPLNW
jgi:hypothetical protein